MSDNSSFEKRGETFEAGFARSEEAEFRALALRNRKLGAWIAKMLGLKDAQADAYIDRLVEAGVSNPGENALFDKIIMDFEAFPVKCSERTLRRMMGDLMSDARAEIEQAGGGVPETE